MSNIPTLCPKCYKNVHGGPLADGLIRCDGCGHAFPPAGQSPLGSSYGAPPLPPLPVYGGGGGSQPSYASQPFPPTYPPAPGPQSSGSPGLMACGVIVGFLFFFSLCCGGVGFVAFSTVSREIARQEEAIPFPAINPPPPTPVQVPPIHVPPFEFPPIQPIAPPDINPVIPADPVLVPPVVIPPTIPGTPPAARTLDDVLTAIKASSPTDFNSHQFLRELAAMPVEESRRGDVVAAVLKYLAEANAIGALTAQPIFEKWANAADANQIAQFAASHTDRTVRRIALETIGRTGGDAETAKTLVGMLEDRGSTFAVQAALLKIGPSAEDAVLASLESTANTSRRVSYDVLAKIGTAKSLEKLEQMSTSGEGLDRVFARKALTEIKSRIPPQ